MPKRMNQQTRISWCQPALDFTKKFLFGTTICLILHRKKRTLIRLHQLHVVSIKSALAHLQQICFFIFRLINVMPFVGLRGRKSNVKFVLKVFFFIKTHFICHLISKCSKKMIQCRIFSSTFRIFFSMKNHLEFITYFTRKFPVKPKHLPWNSNSHFFPFQMHQNGAHGTDKIDYFIRNYANRINKFRIKHDDGDERKCILAKWHPINIGQNKCVSFFLFDVIQICVR